MERTLSCWNSLRYTAPRTTVHSNPSPNEYLKGFCNRWCNQGKMNGDIERGGIILLLLSHLASSKWSKDSTWSCRQTASCEVLEPSWSVEILFNVLFFSSISYVTFCVARISHPRSYIERQHDSITESSGLWTSIDECFKTQRLGAGGFQISSYVVRLYKGSNIKARSLWKKTSQLTSVHTGDREDRLDQRLSCFESQRNPHWKWRSWLVDKRFGWIGSRH